MKILKQILAGIFIGLGGTVFLAIENKVVGGLFFSFASLSVVNFKVMLYTGRIGYFFDYSIKEKCELFVTLFFNLVGVTIVALLVFLMGNETINTRIINVLDSKMSEAWYEVLVRGIMCGVMMVIAVEGFKVFDNPLMKNVIVSLSVALFVISGFEHSIANFYYYFLGLFNKYPFAFLDLLKLIITILGNSLGSILFYLLYKFALKKLPKNEAKTEQK